MAYEIHATVEIADGENRERELRKLRAMGARLFGHLGPIFAVCEFENLARDSWSVAEVVTVARSREPFETVRRSLDLHAQALAENGFPVLRAKIEEEVGGEMAKPALYLETHLRVLGWSARYEPLIEHGLLASVNRRTLATTLTMRTSGLGLPIHADRVDRAAQTLTRMDVQIIEATTERVLVDTARERDAEWERRSGLCMS